MDATPNSHGHCGKRCFLFPFSPEREGRQERQFILRGLEGPPTAYIHKHMQVRWRRRRGRRDRTRAPGDGQLSATFCRGDGTEPGSVVFVRLCMQSTIPGARSQRCGLVRRRRRRRRRGREPTRIAKRRKEKKTKKNKHKILGYSARPSKYIILTATDGSTTQTRLSIYLCTAITYRGNPSHRTAQPQAVQTKKKKLS